MLPRTSTLQPKEPAPEPTARPDGDPEALPTSRSSAEEADRPRFVPPDDNTVIVDDDAPAAEAGTPPLEREEPAPSPRAD